MSEPKPTWNETMQKLAAEHEPLLKRLAEHDMCVNCPACGVGITMGNAGGYRQYCEACVETAVTLQQAQAAIVAMMNECGIACVQISHDGQHNRYTRKSSHGGGGVYYSFTDLAALRDEQQPSQPAPAAGKQMVLWRE